MPELKDLIHGVRVVGIDQSGPANTKETALLWGHAQGSTYIYHGHRIAATDQEILSVLKQQAIVVSSQAESVPAQRP